MVNNKLTKFESFLNKNQFIEIKYQYHPEIFGNWYQDFQSGSLLLRFVNDRGQILVYIKHKDENDWHYLADVLKFFDPIGLKEYFSAPPELEKLAPKLETYYPQMMRLFNSQKKLAALSSFEKKLAEQLMTKLFTENKKYAKKNIFEKADKP